MVAVILLVIGVALVAILYRLLYPTDPSVKGAIGESLIVNDLENLNYWGYKGCGLRNVYVPYHGKKTEIDILYITSKGIIVVESKNYSGYIFGSDNQRQWTSTLSAGRYGGSKKYKFYNPVWQNETHIKALQEYLGGVRAFSFVVFGRNCQLMNLTYNPGNVCICREDEVKRAVKFVLDCSPDIYNPDAVEAMYNRLLPLTHVTEEVKAQHINTVREAKEVYPRCGGKLVLRTARQGRNAGRQFYGCSNYPSCRFTREIEGYDNARPPSGWII